ncbi:MAG TPA: hypothetical protein VLT87_23750 [Thermoanaerobaculia bacterium]|nr:hypothetical protein [Thermoanaerobaculia bacterium]
MQKKSLVKLVFAAFITTATLFGISEEPARADHCPLQYGSCVKVNEICDRDGNCCCEYVDIENPEIICPTWC